MSILKVDFFLFRYCENKLYLLYSKPCGGIKMDSNKNDVQRIFTKNLNSLLNSHNKTQLELANFLGVSNTSVNKWTRGYNTPRMDKIDLICSFFHIRREDLLTDTSKEQTYYTNPETAKVAQEIFDNSDLRILFDAAKDSTPEQLKLAAEMLRQFKKTIGEE